MLSIQTNVNSLVAQQNLSVTSAFQSKTIQQLTSGYRINQSGDDAAGLAVANKFRSAVAELTQGVANGNDATAQLQIMDGGMSNISSILDRLKTLATQSASGTFTGNRITLNSEFQNDVLEIDRQSQSIGLNTGGTFAKSLNVYLGQGSGSTSLANAQVTVDLSAATVDSQSLGLKGMQAIAGTADLGSASATSVANILADSSNKSSIPSGSTVFQFSGPGFSSGAVSVSVNLSGMADLNAVVANLNSQIQSTGAGATAADAAFKKAGIVASVHTDGAGGQQLAFTSGTEAFQVQAGDQMANALMGNFSSGATGVGLTSTVTAKTSIQTAQNLTAGKDLYIEISGGGLASAKKIKLTQGDGTGNTDTTVAGAITDLTTQINSGTMADGTASASGAAIKAAGITVQSVNGQLVFSSTDNTPFQVKAAGDTSNWLGLGSSVADAAGAVAYSTITAGATFSSTGLTALAKNSQTSLEFSVNGGPSIALAPIALDGGNAAAGFKLGTADLTNGVGIRTGLNDTLAIVVDGQTANISLDATTGAQAVALSNTRASNLAYDFTAGLDNTVMIGIAGGALQAVTMTRNDADLNGVKADLQAALVTAGFTGSKEITVGGDSTHITLTDTSGATGTGSKIEVQINLVDTTAGKLGFNSDVDFNTGIVSGSATTADQLATQIETKTNVALQGTGASVKVTVDPTNHIVITNTNAGADHTIANVTGSAATAILDTGATVAHLGTNRTLTNLATAISNEMTANATLNAAGLQAVSSTGDDTGSLKFVTTKSNTTFQVNVGAAAAKGTATGTVDLTNGADFSTAPMALNLSIDGSATMKTVLLNQNYGNSASIVSAINAVTGADATASMVSVNGKSYLQIVSSNATPGPGSSVQILGGSANAALGLNTGTNSGADEANIGFGLASNQSAAGVRDIAQATSTLNLVNAAGSSQTGALSFSAIGANGGTQALTISANDPSGLMQSTTITLAGLGSGTATLDNDGSAASLGAAVKYINQQLQKSNNPTLQGIVAVEQNVNGTTELSFMSSLRSFQVGVATGGGYGAANIIAGVNGGVAEGVTGTVSGTGSTISIDSQDGAKAAVSALATAVGKLGSAQAAIGRGENQLSYSISLAQSQITNFSAAESQIRDANVAQQAANLSKAQVLSQASIAAMAQANSAPQAVLALLRG